jgi:hypothetical protein
LIDSRQPCAVSSDRRAGKETALDGNRRVEEHGRVREREARNDEEGRVTRTQREKIGTECADDVREDAGQLAGDDTPR